MAASNNPKSITRTLRRGEPFVWATSVALMLVLLLTGLLLSVVMVNGLGAFWPSDLALARLHEGETLLGEITRREPVPHEESHRLQFKVGNRDLYGLDFRWLDEEAIAELIYPEEAVGLERAEYGNFYGFLREFTLTGAGTTPNPTWEAFEDAWRRVRDQRTELRNIEERIVDRGRELNRLQHQLRSAAVREGRPAADAEDAPAIRALREEIEQLLSRQEERTAVLRENTATFVDAAGRAKTIALMDIVRPYRPNAMSIVEKSVFYAAKIKELFTEEPRESNTEGGLFPAIFGTVMLVFLMSLFCFPFGVVAGVYLREYAREGPLLRLVRIGVNNLAGVPSIVYGIFGLGFFVYGVGGTIDEVFFADRLPAPTFGTGGVLWASLTLSLLTLPVVIVATEEALGSIPEGIRQGSLALGATQFQTLVRLLLPMASPGIMTGFILAMARAAGEVAPLMITGVVKLAPSLPLDGTFPYFHADRKFMHLGFHIYDIGFQSPNVEAAKPMVYVTTLLLVLIVLAMSSAAIYLRNRMRRKYAIGAI